MNRQKYTITFQTYQQATYVKSDCASITFVNQGTNNVLLNNSYVILPQRFLRIEANQDETDTTRYFISFNGVGIPLCNVIIKNYVDDTVLTPAEQAAADVTSVNVKRTQPWPR